MKRIKNLGLAVVAAMALSAVLGAAAASASELNSESYPATITSSGPYGSQTWSFNVGSQACDAPQLEGSLSGPKPLLTAGAKDAKCHNNYIGNELKMNGCKFVYRPGASTGASTFAGGVDIVCPTGKTISLTDNTTLNCKVNVPAQNGLAVSYENVGAGKERAVKATLSATGLKYTQVSGTSCAAQLGSYTNGTLSGSWRVQSSNGLWLANEGPNLPPATIAVKGLPAFSPPQLTPGATGYTTTITGEQASGAQHVVTLSGYTLKCTTANLSSSVTGPTAQFSVTPEYAGCTTSGIPSTVSTNGCTYTFNVLNQAPVGATYAGHADIACPAGKAIEIVVQPVGGTVRCTMTIGAQTTDAGGLSFTNEAATSTIGLGLSIKGIDFHLQKGEGLGACTTQDQTNGTYSGSSTLVGSY